MNIISIIRESVKTVRAQEFKTKEAKEKAAIAKLFNDRYTYCDTWKKNMGALPEPGLFGMDIEAGFAWMCPDCNSIHHPVSFSGIDGLHYPACCRYPKGGRLMFDIKTH